MRAWLILLLIVCASVCFGQDEEAVIAELIAHAKALETRITELETQLDDAEDGGESDDWSSGWPESSVIVEYVKTGGGLPAATVTYTVLQLGTNGVLLFDFVRAHN